MSLCRVPSQAMSVHGSGLPYRVLQQHEAPGPKELEEPNAALGGAVGTVRRAACQDQQVPAVALASQARLQLCIG